MINRQGSKKGIGLANQYKYGPNSNGQGSIVMVGNGQNPSIVGGVSSTSANQQ